MSALKKLKERSEQRRKLLAKQFGTENTKDFSSILGEQEGASSSLSSSLSSPSGVKQSAGSAFAQTPYGKKTDSLSSAGMILHLYFLYSSFCLNPKSSFNTCLNVNMLQRANNLIQNNI